MNDRYLYRAKRTDNGEWVEGFYAYMKPYHYIMPKENYDSWIGIDEKTLCACTGFRDKNGKLIWENDICIINGSGIDDEDGYFVLEWEKSTARFVFDGCCCVDFDNVYGHECEVVGDIFDNPELLEVES